MLPSHFRVRTRRSRQMGAPAGILAQDRLRPCQSSVVARVIDAERAHLAAILRGADFWQRRVLEVGSGDGRLTWGFAPLAGSVLAFDPDENVVSRARAECAEELRDKVRFEVARAEEIDVPPNSVDLVFFSWSL